LPESSLIGEDIISVEPVKTGQSMKGGGVQDFQPQHDIVEPEVTEDSNEEFIPYESLNFGKLKAVAKEKGMSVSPTTKKTEILEFLNGQNEDIA
jgi:hypothetical protein